MILVAHRRNDRASLQTTPRHHGVEVDVRWQEGRLVVAHDPGEAGPDWQSWLLDYDHALLVVNLKEEGLISGALQALAERGIEDFFLLGPDPGEALPWLRQGEARIAVRVSEVHHPATALGLAGLARWVWLDGYDGFPVRAEVLQDLASAGLRLCVASPELYGRSPDEIGAYQSALAAAGVVPQAVCTRREADWAG